MPRSPRIALDPKALKALRLWAALDDTEPSVIVSRLIMDNLPSEIKGVLEPGGTWTRRAKTFIPTESKGSKSPLPLEGKDSLGKRKVPIPLTQNTIVLAKVDEMLKDYPSVTYKEIGQAVGYSRYAISDYHKQKMKCRDDQEPLP